MEGSRLTQKYSRYWLFLPLLFFLLLSDKAIGFAGKRIRVTPNDTNASALKIADPAVQLRVLSFNIWGLPGPLTRYPKNRINEIIHAMAKYDIVTLQEAFAKKIIRNLKNSAFPHQYFGKYRKLVPFISRIGDGLAILSRFPIVLEKRLQYPKIFCMDFDCFATKAAIMVRLQISESLQVDVYTTHLQAQDYHKYAEWIRARQVNALGNFILDNDVGNPTIITGDFNTLDTSNVYEMILKQLGGEDTWVHHIGNNPHLDDFTRRGYTTSNENSWHKNRDSAENKRIDYIFIKNGQDKSFQIKHSEVVFKNPDSSGRNLSDHFGLETLLIIP